MTIRSTICRRDIPVSPGESDQDTLRRPLPGFEEVQGPSAGITYWRPSLWSPVIYEEADSTSLQRLREWFEEALEESPKANRPLQAAILATVGTGKTELMLKALAEFGPDLAEKRVHILVPSNALSGELLERMHLLLPSEANPRLHRGRKDEVLGEPLCHRSMHATVDLVESYGASAADLVCPTCPFADTCEWKAQTRDDAPGVIVMPSTYGTLPAGGRCDVAVVDEDIVLSLAREVTVLIGRLDPSEAPKMPTGVRGWEKGSMRLLYALSDLQSARNKLWNATNGGTRLPALTDLRAAGLNSDFAKLAKSIEYGRAEGLKAALEAALREGGTLEEIKKRMAAADRDYGDAWKHAKLWHSLEAQLSLPADVRDTLNGWRIEESPNQHGGSDRLFVVGYRTRLKFEDKPALVLDATGERRLLELAFPHLSDVIVIAADAPHAYVLQAIDRKNGKQALVTAKTDSETTKQEKAARRRRIVEVTEGAARGRQVGLLTYKGVEESAEVADAPVHLIPGHYGMLRGQNKWKDAEVVVVAGRMMPEASDVENIAGALFFDRPDAVVPGGFIGNGLGTYHMRNGDRIDARVEMHSSPVVERVRKQITEAELVQAVGRARAVQRTADNPVLIVILTSTPVPGLLVNELVEFDGLVPSALELNFAREGIHLERAQHAFRAFDGLFSSEAAARKAYQRAPSGTFPYKIYLKGDVPLGRVKYRLAGNKQRAASAIFDLSRVDDPRGWLTARLGPLEQFEMSI